MPTVFPPDPMAGECRTVTETVDRGHGRIEQRRLQTSCDVLVGYSEWPGRAHVVQLERQAIIQKTGAGREAVVMPASPAWRQRGPTQTRYWPSGAATGTSRTDRTGCEM